jgi:hypothetical protein
VFWFDSVKRLYKLRWRIEAGRIATRYDKLAPSLSRVSYKAGVNVVLI